MKCNCQADFVRVAVLISVFVFSFVLFDFSLALILASSFGVCGKYTLFVSDFYPPPNKKC